MFFLHLNWLIVGVGHFFDRFFPDDIPFAFLDPVIVIGHYGYLSKFIVGYPLVVQFVVFEIAYFLDRTVVVELGRLDQVSLFFESW